MANKTKDIFADCKVSNRFIVNMSMENKASINETSIIVITTISSYTIFNSLIVIAINFVGDVVA